MKNRQCLTVRLVSLVLAFAFFLQELGFAGTEIGATPVSPPLLTSLLAEPQQLDVPTEFCSLKEVSKASGGKLIIQIEDAHANFSGQQNLSGALDFLMSKYGIKLVLSEGGIDDCSLTALKKIATPAVWKRIAKKYLLLGKISGEEYLNLTSEHPMKIMGLEDQELYLKSVQSYGDLATRREKILDYLHAIQRAEDQIKSKLYPKELLQFEKLYGAESSFEKKFKALLEMASQNKIELEKYPNAEKLVELSLQEKLIDFNLSNLELAALLEELRSSPQSLSGDQLDSRLRGNDNKLSRLGPILNTLNMAKVKGVNLEKFPHLEKYAEYLQFFSAIDLDVLLGEMEAIEDEVYLSVIASEAKQSSDTRLIRSIDRYLKLLKTAYQIQMTTKDFETFKANEPDFSTLSYLAFINRKLAELGYFEDLLVLEPVLDEGRKSLEAFYDTVSKRDFVFLQNAEKALAENNANAAFMIAGGYHTPHLKKLLSEKGYSIAVLTPVVTAETNQKKYEKLLLEPMHAEIKKVEMVQGESHADKPLSALEKDLLKSRQKNNDLRPVLTAPGARLAAAENRPSTLTELLSEAGATPQEVSAVVDDFKAAGARMAVSILEGIDPQDYEATVPYIYSNMDKILEMANLQNLKEVKIKKISYGGEGNYKYVLRMEIEASNKDGVLESHVIGIRFIKNGGEDTAKKEVQLFRKYNELNGVAIEVYGYIPLVMGIGEKPVKYTGFTVGEYVDLKNGVEIGAVTGITRDKYASVVETIVRAWLLISQANRYADTGITIGDLKPDNFVVKSKNEVSKVQYLDLGLPQYLDFNSLISKINLDMRKMFPGFGAEEAKNFNGISVAFDKFLEERNLSKEDLSKLKQSVQAVVTSPSFRRYPESIKSQIKLVLQRMDEVAPPSGSRLASLAPSDLFTTPLTANVPYFMTMTEDGARPLLRAGNTDFAIEKRGDEFILRKYAQVGDSRELDPSFQKLMTGKPFIAGRDASELSDPGISTRHFEIHLDASQGLPMVVVQDLESTNGTKVPPLQFVDMGWLADQSLFKKAVEDLSGKMNLTEMSEIEFFLRQSDDLKDASKAGKLGEFYELVASYRMPRDLYLPLIEIAAASRRTQDNEDMDSGETKVLSILRANLKDDDELILQTNVKKLKSDDFESALVSSNTYKKIIVEVIIGIDGNILSIGKASALKPGQYRLHLIRNLSAESGDGAFSYALDNSIPAQAKEAIKNIVEKMIDRFNVSLASPAGVNEEISLQADAPVEIGAEEGLAILAKTDIHGRSFKGEFLTTDLLRREGMIPKHRVNVDGQVLLFASNLFEMKDKRLAAIAYVKAGNRYVARTYYLSNSQALWRYLPSVYLDGLGEIDWYDKGFGEDSITLPFEIQVALNKISEQKKIVEIRDKRVQELIFAGTTRDYQNNYDLQGTYKMAIDRNAQRLKEGSLVMDRFGMVDSTKKPRPEDVRFTDPGDAPNFEGFDPKKDQTTMQTNLYGMVTARVFRSLNKNLRFIFMTDKDGRSWIGSIETTGKIGVLGLRAKWVKGGSFTTPAYEYRKQAREYAGQSHPSNTNYVDVSEKYLNRIPVIAEFRKRFGAPAATSTEPTTQEMFLGDGKFGYHLDGKNLVVTTTSGSPITLTPEKRYFVGRNPENEISIPGSTISRKHAEIFFEEGQWKIKISGVNGALHQGQSFDQGAVITLATVETDSDLMEFDVLARFGKKYHFRIFPTKEALSKIPPGKGRHVAKNVLIPGIEQNMGWKISNETDFKAAVASGEIVLLKIDGEMPEFVYKSALEKFMPVSGARLAEDPMAQHVQVYKDLKRDVEIEASAPEINRERQIKASTSMTSWLNQTVRLAAEAVSQKIGVDLNDFVVASYGSLARKDELVYFSDIDFKVIPVSAANKENAKKIHEAIKIQLEQWVDEYKLPDLDVDEGMKESLGDKYFLSLEELGGAKEIWAPFEKRYEPAIDADIEVPSNTPTTFRDIYFVAGSRDQYDQVLIQRIVANNLYGSSRSDHQKALLEELDSVQTPVISGAKELNIKLAVIRAIHFLVWHEKSRHPELRSFSSSFEVLERLPKSQKVIEEYALLLKFRGALKVASGQTDLVDEKSLRAVAQLWSRDAAEATPEQVQQKIRNAIADIYSYISEYFKNDPELSVTAPRLAADFGRSAEMAKRINFLKAAGARFASLSPANFSAASASMLVGALSAYTALGIPGVLCTALVYLGIIIAANSQNQLLRRMLPFTIGLFLALLPISTSHLLTQASIHYQESVESSQSPEASQAMAPAEPSPLKTVLTSPVAQNYQKVLEENEVVYYRYFKGLFDSKTVPNFVTAIAYNESGDLKTVRQRGGPAALLENVEPETMKTVLKWSSANPKLKQVLFDELSQENVLKLESLIENLKSIKTEMDEKTSKELVESVESIPDLKHKIVFLNLYRALNKRGIEAMDLVTAEKMADAYLVSWRPGQFIRGRVVLKMWMALQIFAAIKGDIAEAELIEDSRFSSKLDRAYEKIQGDRNAVRKEAKDWAKAKALAQESKKMVEAIQKDYSGDQFKKFLEEAVQAVQRELNLLNRNEIPKDRLPDGARMAEIPTHVLLGISIDENRLAYWGAGIIFGGITSLGLIYFGMPLFAAIIVGIDVLAAAVPLVAMSQLYLRQVFYEFHNPEMSAGPWAPGSSSEAAPKFDTSRKPDEVEFLNLFDEIPGTLIYVQSNYRDSYYTILVEPDQKLKIWLAGVNQPRIGKISHLLSHRTFKKEVLLNSVSEVKTLAGIISKNMSLALPYFTDSNKSSSTHWLTEPGQILVQRPTDALSSGARLSASEVPFDNLIQTFSRKYEMRRLLDGGPMIQPEYVVFGKRFVNGSWQGPEPFHIRLLEEQPVLELIPSGGSRTPRQLLDEIMSGARALPIVVKANSMSMGNGIFMIEKNQEGAFVITFADYRSIASDDQLQRVKAHFSFRKVPVLDKPSEEITQLVIDASREDAASRLREFWELFIGENYGVAETLSPVLRYHGKALELRTRYQFTVGGDVVLLKERDGDKNLSGWHSRVGSSSYFTFITGEAQTQKDYWPTIYAPLYEAAGISEGKKDGFSKQMDEQVKAEVRYLSQRLKAIGVPDGFELDGQIDLMWLPASGSEDYPRPVVIEAKLRPVGAAINRMVNVDLSALNSGARLSGTPTQNANLITKGEDSLKGPYIQLGSDKIYLSLLKDPTKDTELVSKALQDWAEKGIFREGVKFSVIAPNTIHIEPTNETVHLHAPIQFPHELNRVLAGARLSAGQAGMATSKETRLEDIAFTLFLRTTLLFTGLYALTAVKVFILMGPVPLLAAQIYFWLSDSSKPAVGEPVTTALQESVARVVNPLDSTCIETYFNLASTDKERIVARQAIDEYFQLSRDKKAAYRILARIQSERKAPANLSYLEKEILSDLLPALSIASPDIFDEKDMEYAHLLIKFPAKNTSTNYQMNNYIFLNNIARTSLSDVSKKARSVISQLKNDPEIGEIFRASMDWVDQSEGFGARMADVSIDKAREKHMKSIMTHGILSRRAIMEKRPDTIFAFSRDLDYPDAGGDLIYDDRVYGVAMPASKDVDQNLDRALGDRSPFSMLPVVVENDSTDEDVRERLNHTIIVMQIFKDAKLPYVRLGKTEVEREGSVSASAIDVFFVPETMLDMASRVMGNDFKKVIVVKKQKEITVDSKKETHRVIAPSFKEALAEYIAARPSGDSSYWMHAVRFPIQSDLEKISANQVGARMAGSDEIKKLIEDLKNEDGNIRVRSARTLAEMGPSAQEAIPALIEALKDKNLHLRRSAAIALGEIGPATKEVIPALIEALKDEEGYAYIALGKIGPAAKEAIPTLLERLKDESGVMRHGDVLTLGRIGAATKEVIPALIEASKDKDPTVRRNAATALGQIGPAAREVVPALIEALKDKDWLVRHYAAESLGKIGPAAQEAIPALVEASKDEDLGNSQAIVALGKIDPTAEEPIPALIEALKDKDRVVRRNAAITLGQIGPAAKEVIPALIEALKDEDPSVRLEAAFALGRIGPVAPNIALALIELLNDKYKIVSESAIQALGRMNNSSTRLISFLEAAYPYGKKYSLSGFEILRLADFLAEKDNEPVHWASDKEIYDLAVDAVAQNNEVALLPLAEIKDSWVGRITGSERTKKAKAAYDLAKKYVDSITPEDVYRKYFPEDLKEEFVPVVDRQLKNSVSQKFDAVASLADDAAKKHFNSLTSELDPIATLASEATEQVNKGSVANTLDNLNTLGRIAADSSAVKEVSEKDIEKITTEILKEHDYIEPREAFRLKRLVAKNLNAPIPQDLTLEGDEKLKGTMTGEVFETMTQELAEQWNGAETQVNRDGDLEILQDAFALTNTEKEKIKQKANEIAELKIKKTRSDAILKQIDAQVGQLTPREVDRSLKEGISAEAILSEKKPTTVVDEKVTEEPAKERRVEMEGARLSDLRSFYQLNKAALGAKKYRLYWIPLAGQASVWANFREVVRDLRLGILAVDEKSGALSLAVENFNLNQYLTDRRSRQVNDFLRDHPKDAKAEILVPIHTFNNNKNRTSFGTVQLKALPKDQVEFSIKKGWLSYVPFEAKGERLILTGAAPEQLMQELLAPRPMFAATAPLKEIAPDLAPNQQLVGVGARLALGKQGRMARLQELQKFYETQGDAFKDAEGAVADTSFYKPTDLKSIFEVFEKLLKEKGSLEGKQFFEMGSGDFRVSAVAAYLYGMKITAVEKDADISRAARDVLIQSKFWQLVPRDNFTFLGNTDALAVSWSQVDVFYFYYTQPSGLGVGKRESFQSALREKLGRELKPGAFAVMGQWGNHVGPYYPKAWGDPQQSELFTLKFKNKGALNGETAFKVYQVPDIEELVPTFKEIYGARLPSNEIKSMPSAFEASDTLLLARLADKVGAQFSKDELSRPFSFLTGITLVKFVDAGLAVELYRRGDVGEEARVFIGKLTFDEATREKAHKLNSESVAVLPRVVGQQIQMASPEVLELNSENERVTRLITRLYQKSGISNDRTVVLRIVTEKELSVEELSLYASKIKSVRAVAGSNVLLQFGTLAGERFLEYGASDALQGLARDQYEMVYFSKLSDAALKLAQADGAGAVVFENFGDGKSAIPFAASATFAVAAARLPSVTDTLKQMWNNLRSDSFSELLPAAFQAIKKVTTIDTQFYKKLSLKVLAVLDWAKFVEFAKTSLASIGASA